MPHKNFPLNLIYIILSHERIMKSNYIFSFNCIIINCKCANNAVEGTFLFHHFDKSQETRLSFVKIQTTFITIVM